MYWRTLAAVVLISSQAQASDSLRGTYGLQETVDAQAGNWTSFNVGLHVGTMHTDGQTNRGYHEGALIDLDIGNGLFPAGTSKDGTAASLSLSAGYDHQFQSFILGGEVDVSFAEAHSHYGQNRIDPNPAAPFTGVQTITGWDTSLEMLSTARLRVGYDLGSTMIYATGGMAVGEVYNNFSLRIPELAYTSPAWNNKSVEYGYVLGAGLEHRISSNLRLRAEVQYIDLGDTTVSATDSVNFPGQRIDYAFDNTFTNAKLGIVYGF